MSTITTNIFKAIEGYTNFVETGAEVLCASVDATISCADGLCNTAATGWRQGLTNTALESLKWCTGFKDYEKACEALRKKPPIPIPHTNGAQLIDSRTFSYRLGEASGHMINGGCKAVTSAVFATGAAACVFGTVSNSITFEPSYKFGDFHRASRLLASGVKELTTVVLPVIWEGAKISGRALSAIPTAAVNNPSVTLNTIGMGGTLYFSTSNIVKASKAQTLPRKIGHSALAALGLAATVCVPYATQRLTS